MRPFLAVFLRPFFALALLLTLFLTLTLSLSLPCLATQAVAQTQTGAMQTGAVQPPSGDAKSSARATASAQKKQSQKAANDKGNDKGNDRGKGKGKAKEAPHGSARHLGAALGAGTSWYLDGTPRAGRGAVWERGIPMENLSRKRVLGSGGADTTTQGQTQGRMPGSLHGQSRELAREQRAVRQLSPVAQSGTLAGQNGVDTTKGIDSALGEISSYERQPADGSAIGLKKPGAPSLQMTTEESSWRNPVTQPHIGGQSVMTTRHNVVGAYADVVKSDDLHVTLGPELHIPESDPTVKHLSPQQNESSTLGFGMKWQWDF